MAARTRDRSVGPRLTAAARSLRLYTALLAFAGAVGAGCSGCPDGDGADDRARDVDGAAGAVAATTAVRGGSWAVGSIADADNLLPGIASDSASYDIIGHVYCKLLKYDGDLEVTGELAQRYEVSDGGQRIRFWLNPDARWHDGEPVTADDVVFTVEALLDPKTPSPYKSQAEVLEEIRKIDEHTVEAVYERPYAPALDDWASSFYLLPAHLLRGEDLLTSDLARKPVGCGPYRFVRWEDEREIELVANDDHYAGPPNIEHYLYRVIPDQATMFMELMNFGIDQMGLTPQQAVYQAKGRKFKENFESYRYTGFAYTYLGFNLRRPPFDDRRVRRALAHAVDKEEIIEGVLLGLGQVATGPYRPGMWYHNPDVPSPVFDPGRARAMLDEAGWTDDDGDGVREKDLDGDGVVGAGERLSFTLITNQGNVQRKQVGEILQQRFREVGAKVELRILEWSTFLREFVDKGRFDAVILGWSTGIDPDQYDIWHSSKTDPREFNFVGFDNAEVDRLLEQGRRTFDEEARTQAYMRIQEILAREQPYVFLYIPESLPVVQHRVEGVELKSAGITYNFEDWWIPEARQGFHHRR